MTHPEPDLPEVLGHVAADKRIDILRRIGMVGSISEAARGAGVSYKAAWQALETLNNLAGTPLLEKAVGGSGGGGAALTAAGQRVLTAAERLSRARSSVLAGLERDWTGAGGAPGLAASGLRTSMRNQFPCVIRSMQKTRGLVRVRLTLPNGASLLSRITGESVELLELAKGKPVLALCKATAVLIAPRVDATPSLNVLQGTVLRTSRTRRGGEVALGLGPNLSLVGFAPAGRSLAVGQQAQAGVEETAVVIASAE